MLSVNKVSHYLNTIVDAAHNNRHHKTCTKSSHKWMSQKLPWLLGLLGCLISRMYLYVCRVVVIEMNK
jgi:hypothetical protein